MNKYEHEPSGEYYQAQELKVFNKYDNQGIIIEDRHDQIVNIHRTAENIEILTDINRKLVEDQFDPLGTPKFS